VLNVGSGILSKRRWFGLLPPKKTHLVRVPTPSVKTVADTQGAIVIHKITIPHKGPRSTPSHTQKMLASPSYETRQELVQARLVKLITTHFVKDKDRK